MKKLVVLITFSLFLFSCSNAGSIDSSSSGNDSLSVYRADSLKKYSSVQDSLKEYEIIKQSMVDYEKLIELRASFIGLVYEYPKSTDFMAKNGYPETLNGTDNRTWVVYFPKGDVTVIMNKQTNVFTNISFGKNERLKSDVTNELSKLIGRRLSYDDYTNAISSIRYGASEKLGSQNCVNKKCVEYYPKGNFTTVTFNEFVDEGDFVTLLRIAPFREQYLGSF